MRFNQDIYHRKSIHLRGYDYSQSGWYFITLCTYQRLPLFCNIVGSSMVLNPAGAAVEKCWHEIPGHFPQVTLDAFVIMPNHLHGIIMLDDNVGANDYLPLQSGLSSRRQYGTSRTIGSIVRGFKIAVTRWFHANTDVQVIWQRNYYEHIIRNEESYLKIAEYIQANPSMWQNDTYYSE